MITIALDDCDRFVDDDFLQLIQENDDDQYEITTAKETAQFFAAKDHIAMEYYSAAFVGQKLSEISTSFDYCYPGTEETGEFTFTITTSEKEKLAEILTYLSAGYGNLEDEDNNINFHGEAQDLIETATEDTAACFDLVEICRQFI